MAQTHSFVLLALRLLSYAATSEIGRILLARPHHRVKRVPLLIAHLVAATHLDASLVVCHPLLTTCEHLIVQLGLPEVCERLLGWQRLLTRNMVWAILFQSIFHLDVH